jgi:hypothetical protein
MVQYYKVSAALLKEYIRLIRHRMAHVGVAVSLKHILEESRFWVMDDVDYPEAVETAECMAWEKPEPEIDTDRQDGYRWVSDFCLRRLVKTCYARETKVLTEALTTLINHSPYPNDDPEEGYDKAWQLAQR